MAAFRYDEIDSDLSLIFDEIGILIAWNGGSYTAVVTEPQVELDLQSGGFLPESDFQVRLRKTSLPTPWPKNRQSITIQGETFVIKGLTNKPTSPLLILHVVRA